MKKLLYLLIIVLFASCGKNNNEPKGPAAKGKVDLEAMITIKGKTLPVKSPMQKAPVYGLTPLEVVEQAVSIKWTSNWFGNAYTERPEYITRGIADFQRDFETPAVKMYSTDIIDKFPLTGVTFIKDFIYGRDVVIIKPGGDTIAFVPDSVINNARPLIEQAFNDSNYTECYRLFNEAFTFYPLQKAD